MWFVGYTPQIAAAVWVGDPRGGYRYPLNNVVINGVYYSNVYGATIPGPIWRSAMSGAHGGLPIRSFGGGPKEFDVRLKPSDDKDGKDGNKDEPEPLPAEPQAPADPNAGAELDDFNLDELENLPDFSFD